MPQHASIQTAQTSANRRSAQTSTAARGTNEARHRLPVEAWREGKFSLEIRAARIALEPTAVRIISALPRSNAQRKLLLELPRGFFPPGPRAKARPVH